MFYNYAMDLDAFLFDPIVTKIGPSQVGQAQIMSRYIPSSIPVSIAREDQLIVPEQYFWSHSFENNVKSGRPLLRQLEPIERKWGK